MGEKFGRDAIWEGHLASELWSAEVEIEAVLDELELPLRKVMNLQVGQTLPLHVTPDGQVMLRCGDVTITQGHMGRVGENVAVHVTRPLARPKMTLAAFEKADGMKMEAS